MYFGEKCLTSEVPKLIMLHIKSQCKVLVLHFGSVVLVMIFCKHISLLKPKIRQFAYVLTYKRLYTLLSNKVSLHT